MTPSPTDPSAAPPAGRTETAVLGGGCFWCLEAVFQEVGGVLEVQSGYAGGRVPNPTYEQVCGKRTGHVEVVRVLFDPDRIGYEDLLGIFFAVHDPTTLDRQGNDVGPQYRSAIYATTPGQLATAHALVARLGAERVFDAPVVTQVGPLGSGDDRFWPAEAYHDRYFERHPSQGYCAFVIAPKLDKFRRLFARHRRPAASA